MSAAVSAYLESNADRHLAELCELLRIPSISAQPEHRPDMLRAAKFLHDQFAAMGFQVETVPTAGHPIVYAEWLQAPGAPTVLVYGHYDVQPPDPLDLWTTPPFEPTIRDGKLFARGATDDKGQVFTHVKSAEAWLKVEGRLPVNLKFVIEGEEEVDSANVDAFLNTRREALACDVAVISDSSQFAPGIPAICCGLRGIVNFEVRVRGPKKDLHSGMFGGSVANPAHVLARLIASLHDDTQRVQIPGFYDSVVEIPAEERAEFAALPFDDVAECEQLGIEATVGEAGYTTLERRWIRPTCEVNGLTAGYQGPGPKTIVPAWAAAKLSCRLVPDQSPDAVADALQRFFEERLPPGVHLEFIRNHGSSGIAFDRESRFMRAAARAIRAGFGADPVSIREGGSIPIVLSLQKQLGVDTLLLGWGFNTDNLHSPDEHFSVDSFYRGIAASAELWEQLAAE